MTSLPVEWFLVLSGALLAVGVFGLLTRRNFILILIAVEIAMNATILNFVYFAAFAPTAAGL
jgi:NADH:ubiquinone oxidoreductase subunit K